MVVPPWPMATRSTFLISLASRAKLGRFNGRSRGRRMNARPEEGLTGVDIAHAYYCAIVHNEVLDRAFAPLALGLQIAGVKGAGERLGAKIFANTGTYALPPRRAPALDQNASDR